MRVRVWYSLVYLEATLCLVTGRPSALQEQDAGPRPRTNHSDDSESDDGKSDSYYACLMRLSVIASKVHSQLYSARTTKVKKSRDVAKKTIEAVSKCLERWREKLPHHLDFDSEHEDRKFLRQVRRTPLLHESAH
jgi:hypothetical protein